MDNSNTPAFPAEISFPANFNKGLLSQGGKLTITPDKLIFKPHSFNLGSKSERVYNIKDIKGYEKGMLTFLYVLFSDGTKIKLTVSNKTEIINALEARRVRLV